MALLSKNQRTVSGMRLKTLYMALLSKNQRTVSGMRLKTLYTALLSKNQSIGQWHEVKNTVYRVSPQKVYLLK